MEVIGNGSASHHQLRKLQQRIDLIVGATAKCGGVYLYANQCGCDGGRLYFDGSALVVANGKVRSGPQANSRARWTDALARFLPNAPHSLHHQQVLAQAPQFSVRDVEVVAATVDLEDVRSYRAYSASIREQASRTAAVPQVCGRPGKSDGKGREGKGRPPPSSHSCLVLFVSPPGCGVQVKVSTPLVHDLASSDPPHDDDGPPYANMSPTLPAPLRLLTPEEECGMGPACWLWDYLRRSGGCAPVGPVSHPSSSFSVQRSNAPPTPTPSFLTGGAGFLLPLSGGADSSAVAAIVGVMCHLVHGAIEEGNERVLADARRVMGHAPDSDFR